MSEFSGQTVFDPVNFVYLGVGLNQISSDQRQKNRGSDAR